MSNTMILSISPLKPDIFVERIKRQCQPTITVTWQFMNRREAKIVKIIKQATEGLSVRVDIPITKETRSSKCFIGFLHKGTPKSKRLSLLLLFSLLVLQVSGIHNYPISCRTHDDIILLIGSIVLLIYIDNHSIIYVEYIFDYMPYMPYIYMHTRRFSLYHVPFNITPPFLDKPTYHVGWYNSV